MSGRVSFPEVGLYVISRNPEGLFLVQKTSSLIQFPFFSLRGGESWESLLSQIKKEWRIENASHRLLGVSARRNPLDPGRAYCVFQLEAWPKTVPPDFFWEDFTKTLSFDDVTTRIYEHFMDSFSSIWVD